MLPVIPAEFNLMLYQMEKARGWLIKRKFARRLRKVSTMRCEDVARERLASAQRRIIRWDARESALLTGSFPLCHKELRRQSYRLSPLIAHATICRSMIH